MLIFLDLLSLVHNRVNVVFLQPWYGSAANSATATAAGFAMSVTIGSRNMFVINAPEEEEKCTEAQLDILLKINTGEYRLVKKNKRSTVWNVYREIARSDGTKLKWRYFCLGCKRVMQSSGGTTSNLRIHKCHVKFLKHNGLSAGGSRSPSGDVSCHSPPPAAAAKTQPRSQQRTQTSAAKRAPTFAAQFEQFYEIRTETLSEYEQEDDTEESRLEEEEADGVEQVVKAPNHQNYLFMIY